MDNILVNKIENIIKSINNPQNGNYLGQDNEVKIIEEKGNVNISIEIDPKKQSEFDKIKKIIEEKVKLIEQVVSVNVILTAERNTNMENFKRADTSKYDLEAKNIIAISSGKGGVGKSTVAVNLAIALSQIGKSVSLLDADIYGPSIPKMMGISKKPITNKNNKLIPLESYSVKCMSIGFLIEPETPTIWRGPMIMKALEQLFVNVDWGSSDYLIVDLPPGTGDIQISLAQKVPLKGAIIVSTPQDVALIDARKGIAMFNKVNVPVLGIIENMSYFVCDKCNSRHEIFSYGGAKSESSKYNVSFLGEIPINKELRICSDKGKPLAINNPKNEISKIYLDIAKKIEMIK